MMIMSTVQQPIAKIDAEVLTHTPQCPNLVPRNLHLLPRMKMELNTHDLSSDYGMNAATVMMNTAITGTVYDLMNSLCTFPIYYN
jgi:hypothetical protein